MDEILKKGADFLKDNCLITGGHYRIFFNENGIKENINSGTIKSFRLAILLFKFARDKGLAADIGLLINDMGSSCDESACSLKKLGFTRLEYKLPSVYNKILSEEKIPEKSIKIYWEKHSRNRGKKELIKRIKIESDIFIKERNGLFLLDKEGYGKIVLTRIRENDKYGVPACPLIMAGLNIEQSKFYNSSINFYYIAYDNIANIPNHFVIEKGKRVAELFGVKININNIYFE